jgi:hypothetical protein
VPDSASNLPSAFAQAFGHRDGAELVLAHAGFDPSEKSFVER